MSFYSSYPVTGGSSGVPIYPNLAGFPATTTTGALGVDASTGNLYEFNGVSWVLIGSPSSALSLGTFDSETPSPKGANLVSGVLAMQSASATVPGVVNLAAQVLGAGDKTLPANILTATDNTFNLGATTGRFQNGYFSKDVYVGTTPISGSHTRAVLTADLAPGPGPGLIMYLGSGNQYVVYTDGAGVTIGNLGAGSTQFMSRDTTFAFQNSSAVNYFTGSATGVVATGTVTGSNLSGTNTGDQTITLTGDVTGSGTGSFAATIAANAVTNSKLAQMPTLTIKGNNTGGTTNALDLSVAQVNAILPVFTSTLNGLVPLSGGGTTTFLRADGTFATPAGGGTVTAVSVASANGFAGTSSGGATPALTLTTSVTGVLKGNGTAISAATSGTDYSLGTSGLATGILKSTTTTGALTIAVAGDFPTLNQSTTGTASNVTGVVALINGGTGTAAASANAAFNALSPLTTKGDLAGFSTVNARIPIGTDTFVLTADSSQTLGLKWAAASAGTSLNPQVSTTLAAHAVSTWVSSSLSSTTWVNVCYSPAVQVNESSGRFNKTPLVIAIDNNTGDASQIGILGASQGNASWNLVAASAQNTWNGICYSPELDMYVIVASTGTNRVNTSTNATTWTARTAAAANQWQSVCWSPDLSLFCAVSNSGTNRVMTSPDGTTWTSQTAASAILWQDVVWSPELLLFVAVAGDSSTSAVMTSPDGITWTTRTSINSGWSRVCWSPEKTLFVAVSPNVAGAGAAMTSPDGITWTTRTLPGTGTAWHGIAWSPELGLFLATNTSASHANAFATSPDGITWTLRDSGTSGVTGGFATVWAPQFGAFVTVDSTGGLFSRVVKKFIAP